MQIPEWFEEKYRDQHFLLVERRSGNDKLTLKARGDSEQEFRPKDLMAIIPTVFPDGTIKDLKMGLGFNQPYYEQIQGEDGRPTIRLRPIYQGRGYSTLYDLFAAEDMLDYWIHYMWIVHRYAVQKIRGDRFPPWNLPDAVRAKKAPHATERDDKGYLKMPDRRKAKKRKPATDVADQG